MNERYTTGNNELDKTLYDRYAYLVETVRSYIPALNEELLDDVFQFAARFHNKTLRKDGSPYITHPLETAIILTDLAMDTDTIIAALLHDVLEDTRCTYQDIAARFGGTVADLVDGVTKLTTMRYVSKEDHQMENLRKMLMAMAKDIRVLLIKIADRLHNMRTIEYHTEKKRREKSRETMQIYAPLAHRLGISKIKMELEDLALQRLDPVAYKEIQEGLTERMKDEAGFLEQVCASVSERLGELGLKAELESRVKQIYAIFRKMYAQQHRALFEIYDLFAIRVIVDTLDNCYTVLGIVHEMFHAMPGRLKDYISNPRPNGYQSLHTTVIGRKGTPFEIQIRTMDMHHTAEYGIAAHWKYKDKVHSADARLDERLEWVRMLLESQQDTEAEEFIKSFRVDLFEDEVFVFTPKGDVVNLPAGANPIDFAYAIHSAVGNRTTGAKVNGHIVPLGYQLKNGDIVEVLSHNSKGPSREWIRMVRTNEARNKIKQWFKRERREENIHQGRAELEAEIKRGGISPDTLKQEDVLSSLLRKLSFATIDDLCGAIGYGGISAQKAANRIRDELIRMNRLQTDKDVVERMIENIRKAKPPSNASAVVVDELDNFQIKYSRCCAPVPDDKIIGFVTKGYGISIHRADCKNVISARAREEDAGRWLTARWVGDAAGLYETGVRILCMYRDDLTMDISTVMAALKIPMSSYSANVLSDGHSLINMVMRVKDLEQYEFVINKLRRVPSVLEITRSGN
ncbi:MAG: bifunctional (p)ppGpp synthetase/guanosine-3',5'-bis(diphosphate) 3'-pyrophosphohydrolase [Oscillospiraceae bacterium]|nr:bifunctional (p)ppGpp synthetase/guanosine-3',5'-bis(diphosphate) 3'-pyrophosphohydrolase [Oscillospiraceae bacterium]